MNAQSRIPFHFQAGACAFSGTLHRPILCPVEAQAATSLPTIGGQVRSCVENFRADHLIRFAAAHCHVSGSWQDDEIARTQSTPAIEGLNILDFVIANRIGSRPTSGHRRGKIPEKREKTLNEFWTQDSIKYAAIEAPCMGGRAEYYRHPFRKNIEFWAPRGAGDKIRRYCRDVEPGRWGTVQSEARSQSTGTHIHQQQVFLYRADYIELRDKINRLGSQSHRQFASDRVR